MSVRNILKCYSEASQDEIQSGLDWYPNAAFFAEQLGELRMSAGVIAALSPRQQWETNKKAAKKLINYADNFSFIPKVAGTYVNRMKAWRIAKGENPYNVLGLGKRNFKVLRFFENILGIKDVVTIDSWSASVAIPNITTPYIRGRLYLEIEQDFKKAAKKIGVSPRDLQAICWVKKRGKP